MDVFTSELDAPDGMESISITKEHIEKYGNDIEIPSLLMSNWKRFSCLIRKHSNIRA